MKSMMRYWKQAKRILKKIELWLHVLWAIRHHKIARKHLSAKYWRSSQGTSLFFILKQHVPMWHNGSDFGPGQVLFIAPTGVTFTLDNKDITATLDVHFNPIYYFKMPPTILYGEASTKALRKIISIQATYGLLINFKNESTTK